MNSDSDSGAEKTASRYVAAEVETHHTHTLVTGGAAAERERRAATHSGDAPEVGSADEDVLDELVGTALVLAFLQVGALMPVVELARLRSAAARFFEGITVRPACPGAACRKR